MESIEPGRQKQAAKSVNSTSQVQQFFGCFCYSKQAVDFFAQQAWAWGGRTPSAQPDGRCALCWGRSADTADVLLTLWGHLNSSQPLYAPDNLANHTCCTWKNDLCKPNDFPFKDMTLLCFIVSLFKLSHWFYLGLRQRKCYCWSFIYNPSFCCPETRSWNVIWCLNSFAFHVSLWQRTSVMKTEWIGCCLTCLRVWGCALPELCKAHTWSQLAVVGEREPDKTVWFHQTVVLNDFFVSSIWNKRFCWGCPTRHVSAWCGSDQKLVLAVPQQSSTGSAAQIGSWNSNDHTRNWGEIVSCWSSEV